MKELYQKEDLGAIDCHKMRLAETLRQLFQNKSDCYADMNNKEVVQAMTMDRFVEILLDPIKEKEVAVIALAKENEELKERNNNTFNQGYVLAVAELIRQHGRQVEARDILKGLGKVDWSKIAEYDKEPLKKAHLI